MKSLKIFWIIAGLLLVLYIIAQATRPKEIDWTESLSSKEKAPYGTYVLKSRLNDIFPQAAVSAYRQPVYNVIADDSAKNATYLIIAPGLQLSKDDYEQLIKYIKKGNDVFLATEYFGALFNKNLKIATKYAFDINNNALPVSLVNRHLSPKKKYALDKGIGSIYFDSFDTLKTTVLGVNSKNQPDYIKLEIGKGRLYLFANPRFLSNYSLLQSQGSEYASKVLSYLKNTPKVLFDEYYTQGEAGDETPMRVFLNNPDLRWAYFIALFSLLLFVIYDIKRRQRIIPVIEPLANSTLEFVTVVGQLYYEKRNNADIAKKKIRYFLNWLRDKYNITANITEKEFPQILIQKLNFKPDFAVQFTGFTNYVYTNEMITDKELIKLNSLTEQFYQQAK